MFSKSMILFQIIEIDKTVEHGDHRTFWKYIKIKVRNCEILSKNRKCGKIMFFCSHEVFAPNWTEISLEFFCLNVSIIFPNRTGIGSEKFWKNPYQKCRTELESVRKKFSKFLGLFFRTELESVRKRTLNKM